MATVAPIRRQVQLCIGKAGLPVEGGPAGRLAHLCPAGTARELRLRL